MARRRRGCHEPTVRALAHGVRSEERGGVRRVAGGTTEASKYDCVDWAPGLLCKLESVEMK
jgi:hypothetical protein